MDGGGRRGVKFSGILCGRHKCMLPNDYLDFPLLDKMFPEVLVNTRQIVSQELHIIFALGFFSLLQNQFF